VVACSFLIWLIRALIPQDRVRFVRNHLRRGVRFGDATADGGQSTADGRLSVDTVGTVDRRAADVNVRRFTEFYLRVDGVFLLRLIAHNTNGITTTEITRELWDLWVDRQRPQNDTPENKGLGVEMNETSPLYGHRAD